jgi:hypothetical protein
LNLTEQKFWNLIKAHLPGDASRVENSTDEGMPDINCTYLIDYWIELKVCSNKEAIRNVTSLLRESQIVWHYRRGKVGALIFVMVRYETSILVYQYSHISFSASNPERAYELVAVLKKVGGFDWEFLNYCIKDKITGYIQRLKERT